MLSLGRNVCRLRQKRSLTQEDLAGLAEIDRRYVQRIEAGTANPGIDVLQRIKSSLGCTWADLLRDIE
jgi:transcriptional regulator with XRE-family HTH domain